MDFTKFVSLLEKRALFFARADKLGDPFEGSLPKKNIISRSTSDLDFSDEATSMYAFTIEQLPRFTLISCWHESSHESEAMWKLYSSDNSGIAIKTHSASFLECFITSEQIHIGRIQYVDYDSDLIPENNLLSPYLHKRKSFEHEREVRAIVQNPPIGDSLSDLRTSIQNMHDGEIVAWEDICHIGNYYEVDLNQLIYEVVVAPFAPEWFLELVKSVVTRYGLEIPINRSRLAESPTW